MIEIKSRNNEKIVALSRLLQGKYRQEEKRFLVEGFHLVDMAYAHQKLELVLTLMPLGNRYEAVEQFLVTPKILEKLSQLTTPPPIIGVCRYQDTVDLEGDKLLYLDTINDPGNLGTILRTALAFGFDGIAASPQSVSLYNHKTIMASQGAIFDIPFVTVDLPWLMQKKKTHTLLVSTLEDATSLDKIHTPTKFVLVLGNESHGVSQDIHAIADIKIKIPMQSMESLNVAIAGAILMYHLSR